ncbi:MAG: mandelate racemase/muconate lactonizing enzyme family protein [Acidisphaera sp.]|nr:mandelate racemase/muconate lactonizing enzyme family protein [Acidisphaera sp.]
MKITAVETHLMKVKFDMGAPPKAMAGIAWGSMDTLLVRVVTDQGLEGWGEGFGHAVCPATRVAFDTLVGPAALGQDFRPIRALMAQLQQRLHLFGRNGPVVYALAALDVALWDIAGKAAGLPLCRLLGGPPPAPRPAYASLLRYGEPDAVARACERAAAAGYRHVKLHEIELPLIAAARRALGPDIALMVDCNCPWTIPQAIDMAQRMAEHDLTWLEEPVWPPEDHAGLARVRLEGRVPIAAGENAAGLHDFLHQFEADALDIAQPSLAKIGGITEQLKIAALAEAHGVRLVPHCAYFGPGYLASLHLAGVIAPHAPFERLFVDLEASPFHDLVTAPGGMVPVPDGPGLGCDPDLSVLQRFRVGEPTVLRA